MPISTLPPDMIKRLMTKLLVESYRDFIAFCLSSKAIYAIAESWLQEIVVNPNDLLSRLDWVQPKPRRDIVQKRLLAQFFIPWARARGLEFTGLINLSNLDLAEGARQCTGLSVLQYQQAIFFQFKARQFDFKNIKLEFCDLVQSNWSSSKFTRASFNSSSLRGALFQSAQLISCDFRNTDCRGVDFTGAKIEKCDFTGADLRAAKFPQTRLKDNTALVQSDHLPEQNQRCPQNLI